METLVLKGVRQHLVSADEPSACLADRDLIERHVARVIVKRQAVEVHLAPPGGMLVQSEVPETDDEHLGQKPAIITLPRTAASFVAVKGIVQAPSENLTSIRDALLSAISNARRWIEDIRLGRVGSVAEIATKELKESATSAC